ncbi:endonuclease/exonuclease/phosphatase family protein [Leptolyngbya iicbica]|uniref:Metal-dependent hydrolase n=2 Tax=Cyanophyceae TaxID=3028117 RepID=A0A4Q7E981_9CYAN|nr:endonuclease/exonuclease/phosphatase family protein [Leptolyngbya sp. LK]RZM79172.1 metal-dependent hydrolase [Leptolyngbya sp. LK]
MNRLTGLGLGLLIVLGGSLAGLALFFAWASAGRLSESEYAQIVVNDAYPLSAETDEFSVVSYNIGYLSGLTNNQAVRPAASLYETNLAAAIAALAPLNPDIVALQEIDLESRRSYQVDQVAALGDALAYPQRAIAINWDKRYVPFPYWPPAVHFGQMLSGQAILSRWPIVEQERIVLSKVASKPFYYNALYLDRLAQVAQIELNGQAVVVINVHLEAFDRPTRQTQTEVVLALAEDYATRHPVILLGDFNSALNRDAEGSPRSIQTVLDSTVFEPAVPLAQLSDAAQATYPSDRPEFKLDYIFYTPASLELLEARVITAAGQASDHLPLWMRWRLK